AFADRTDSAPIWPSQSSSRRAFVGREAELEQLRGLVGAAIQGDGALVLITGEPGIGKSALCQQLAEIVSGVGGVLLTGHCYEAASGSLPYLPFVEALHSYVRTRDAAGLRLELGSSAPDIARLVTDL